MNTCISIGVKQIKNVFFLFLFFCWSLIKAQTQTLTDNAQPRVEQSFRPVFAVGALGSQIDGDTYSGYKHLGFFLGAGINRQLSKVIEVEFMLTFLQKGVRSNYRTDSASLNNPNNPFTLTRLNYLEIPLYFRFAWKKFKAEAGGAAGFLVRYPPYNHTQAGQVPDYQNKNWNRFDYSFLIGVGYQITHEFFIDIRWEYSLVPMSPYNYGQSTGVYRGPLGGIFHKGLYNNCLMLLLSYKLPYKAKAVSIGSNGH
ncbi:MAG: PorT family protein [Bacteroidetes bacterium]|nr:PorT family protein [Bacteroidota bacterium]